MNVFEKLRQTGRTTRMINDVIDDVLAGKKVAIVGASRKHAEELLVMFRKNLADRFGTEKTQAIDSPAAFSIDEPNVDLLGGTIKHWPDDSKTFFDHHAIEVKILPVLEELHRYDPKGNVDVVTNPPAS